jgi:MFS family permease
MTLQSLFSLGSIVGLLTMPMISDIKGKKLVILLCLVFIFGGNIALVLGILYKIYVFIGLGMFFSALGSVSTVGISFSINSDFYSDDLRQKAMIYYCAVW